MIDENKPLKAIPRQNALSAVLAGETVSAPPWWLMRQAGRYLPEYREVRGKAADFIELCLTPTLAAELTLQPLRRYRMSAAIVFSDILLLPYALGQKLEYRDREGPVLEPIVGSAAVGRLELARAPERLEPVLETVSRVRAQLDPAVALIGFAGAPWTVAAYMVEGRGSRDFFGARKWAYRDPTGFAALIDVLVGSTVDFLAAQIEAGVEVVQLFDSWAGVLPESELERWVIAPTQRIVSALKKQFPETPVIGFPRGAGLLYRRYAEASGVDVLALDTMVPASFARDCLQPLLPVQGNLDPVALLVGGEALESAVRELIRTLGGGPWVMNLGHGVLPQTPPENIAVLAGMLAAL